MNPGGRKDCIAIPIPSSSISDSSSFQRGMRHRCITRILATLIGVFTTFTVFYAHSQLYAPSHNEVRTLLEVDPRTITLEVKNASKVDMVIKHEALEKQLPIVPAAQKIKHSQHGKRVPGAAASPKKNVPLVVPRSRLYVDLLERLERDQKEDNRTLEEDGLLLVEPPSKKLSREREQRRKEVQALRARTWEKVQEQRKKHVREECRRQPELRREGRLLDRNNTRLSHFLVSDSFKLVFAAVPSVASAFWEDVFEQLPLQQEKGPATGSGNSKKPASTGSLRRLDSYTDTEVRYRLLRYKKLLFVRDPFARLLSTYRRKFLQTSSPEHQLYAPLIAKTYRDKDADLAANITFKEFAYFVDDFSAEIHDSLWEPMSDLALPCDIKYDFIGKLEDGPKEFENMLKNAKIQSLVKYKSSGFQSASHDGAIYDHYFLQLWPAQIKRLYYLYKADFELFGYSIPNYMRPWVFDQF